MCLCGQVDRRKGEEPHVTPCHHWPKICKEPTNFRNMFAMSQVSQSTGQETVKSFPPKVTLNVTGGVGTEPRPLAPLAGFQETNHTHI